MKYGRYGWSYRWLRLGLGTLFLLVGLSIWRNPEAWLPMVPVDVVGLGGLSQARILQVVGFFDLGVGAALLLHWWPRLTAFLASFHLLSVLLLTGITPVTIRDVGLLGAALALLFWPGGYKKHRLRSLWRRKRSTSTEE